MLQSSHMELSERCIQTLEKEGFSQVYEWSGAPQALYLEQQTTGAVAIYVGEGSFELTVADDVHDLRAGDRQNITTQQVYSGVAGQFGCQLVIGEMKVGF